MRHVAAFLLAALGGNSNPTEKDIKAIMNSVGIEPDATQLAIVIKELKGKDVFQVMEQGKALLAEMPAGGVSSGASTAAAAPVAEAPKEEKKEVVESEESDSDMGMGLFD